MGRMNKEISHEYITPTDPLFELLERGKSRKVDGLPRARGMTRWLEEMKVGMWTELPHGFLQTSVASTAFRLKMVVETRKVEGKIYVRRNT